MDQWALVVVLVAAVVAAWDFGRRLTLRTSNQAIDDRFATLGETLIGHNNRLLACQKQVDDLEAKLKGLSNKTEAAAAVNRPRGFPRIG